MKVLNIRQAIRYGFSAFLPHVGFFAMAGLIVASLYYVVAFSLTMVISFFAKDIKCGPIVEQDKALTCLLKYISNMDPINPIMVFTIIVGIIAMLMISIWRAYMYMNICLQIRDKGAVSFKDIYSFMPELANLFLTSFIIVTIFCLGLVAFIIPGIYWLVRSWFAPFVILDKKMDTKSAIKKSFDITQGHEWKLIALLMILLFIISISTAPAFILMSLCEMLTNNSFGCIIPAGLVGAVVAWAIGIVVTLIAIDAYRQLNPKR